MILKSESVCISHKKPALSLLHQAQGDIVFRCCALFAVQGRQTCKDNLNFIELIISLSGFIGATLAAEPGFNGQVLPSNQDSSYGGIFTTTKPYVHPDEYNQPEDKQDAFDWKLSKVRN